jgi:uncharacterized protein (UPF0335 family)
MQLMGALRRALIGGNTEGTTMEDQIGGNAAAQLKSIIERVENLTEEKRALAEDIRGVYAEAKSNGFDVRALRALVKLRAQNTGERQAADAILQAYASAIGFEW